MSSNGDELIEEVILSNGDSFERVKQRLKDRSKGVVEKKEMLSNQTKEILSKQAVKIAKQAEDHEKFINKDQAIWTSQQPLTVQQELEKMLFEPKICSPKGDPHEEELSKNKGLLGC